MLPLGGLLWLGLRLLEQDRVLETKLREEQFGRALERAVAATEQRLSGVLHRLDCRDLARAGAPGEAAGIEFDGAGMRACGGEKLLWIPEPSRLPEAAPQIFAEAERAEFQESNLVAAERQYSTLSQSRDEAVRAGALVRLARVLRKSGRLADTLPLYDSLSRIAAAGVSGLPADLVARAARCRVLAELHRSDTLRLEGRLLADDLDNGKWSIDRAAYELHRGDAAAWSGRSPDMTRERIALAADSLYARWRSGRLDGEPYGAFAEPPLTVIWRKRDHSLTALIARPAYVERQFVASPLHAVLDSTARDNARRYPGLPWPVTASWNAPASLARESAQRRTLVLLFLGLAVLLSAASGWYLWRAFARERALARLQSDFVSAVSHEFRAPLTSMKQITEVLLEGRLFQEDRRRTYYESLARATQRLQRLVESLLDFARMEAGAMPYRQDRIALGELVRGLADDFSHEYGRAGFRLEVTHPPADLVVRGDREALAQAVWNLLDNAVKYSTGSKMADSGCRRDAGIYRDLGHVAGVR